MPKLKVVVPLLNKRTLPVPDTTDKSNATGKVKKDFQFESIAQEKNASGDWFKDRDGSWYWGGGLEEVDASFKAGSEAGETPWWMQQLKIPEIWNTYHEKGANAKVAVIDSGYNINNPEIKNAVVGEFVHPAFPATVTINDILGHGSYCASIIGSRNKTQMIACAPECKLFIAKVTSRGTFDNTKIKDAIQWAIDQDVDIISLSIGGEKNDDINELVSRAVEEKNIIVVSAIGNNDDPESIIAGGDYPALFKDCIAVGATDKTNNLDKVTLLNEKTEINAPGVDIPGYILDPTPGTLPSGTSQATAIIAGICALIVSRHKKINKKYTVDSIKHLITENIDPVLNFPKQKLISPIKIFPKI